MAVAYHCINVVHKTTWPTIVSNVLINFHCIVAYLFKTYMITHLCTLILFGLNVNCNFV